MLVDPIMQSGHLRLLAFTLLSFPAVSCAVVLGLERGELGDDGQHDAAARDDGGEGSEGGAGDRYSELVLAEGPLAYYPFTEAALAPRVANRAPLASPRERDGVVAGATLGLPGALGALDGAMAAEAPRAHVELTWSGIPAGNEPFSVEVAVAPRDIVADRRVIVAHPDTTSGPFAGYRIVSAGAEVAFERRATDGQTELLRADHALASERWTHVAVTFDGGRLRLFVDGAVADEVRTSLRVDGTGSSIVVGSRTDDELPFTGRIDELAIYPREVPVEVLAAHAALLR